MCVAQSYKLTSTNKKALKYYNEAASNYKLGNYNTAVTFLNKSIKYDKGFIEAQLLLGDSYSGLKSNANAITAYKAAIRIDSLFFPMVYYMLGNLNYKIGNYQEAVNNYLFFLSLPNVQNDMRVLTIYWLLYARVAARLVQNPVPVTIKNVGSPVNTKNDEYINYVNADNNYMMLTRRTQLSNSEVDRPAYDEEILYSTKNDLLWDPPYPVNITWKNDLDMGSLNLSTDGRNMYFTGCYWPGGEGGCDLYISQKLGDVWLDPKNIGENINTNSWESQPIISSDGKKLFFASKRKGGKGGSDIWMSVKLKNNTWSPPINLGDSINTPKDEMAPFLHADGSTLYFSSTGHPGLGGYDLFVSRKDELGRWSLAKNIGFPTNSRFDDINIFVSIDGTRSWISSNRPGGYGGMDIYSFKNYPAIIPQKIMFVEGTIVDKITKLPLKADVNITNLSTQELVNNTTSDPITGKFLIVIFPGINYAFNISKKGYLFFSENINLKDSTNNNSVEEQFELSPFIIGSDLVMNNIFFKFDEYELLPASYYELNKLVAMLKQNPGSDITIVGYTDNVGSNDYNVKLSLLRAKAVSDYLINAGIDGKRLNTKGMGASNPIDVNTSELGRAHNRRTEVKVR